MKNTMKAKALNEQELDMVSGGNRQDGYKPILIAIENFLFGSKKTTNPEPSNSNSIIYKA